MYDKMKITSSVLKVKLGKWWALRDLNPGPLRYERSALTTYQRIIIKFLLYFQSFLYRFFKTYFENSPWHKYGTSKEKKWLHLENGTVNGMFKSG